MRRHELAVVVHGERFKDDEDDDVILAECGNQGWIYLSKDEAIRRRELERRALLRAGVHAFFLGRQDLRGAEMAEIFSKAAPKMERMVANATKPILAVIHKDASIDLLDKDLRIARKTRPKKRRNKGL